MDAIGIPEDERRALEEILERRAQVQVIACGHVDRATVGALGRTTVLALPGSDMQLAMDFTPGELRFVPEPPSLGIHVRAGGRIARTSSPSWTAG